MKKLNETAILQGMKTEVLARYAHYEASYRLMGGTVGELCEAVEKTGTIKEFNEVLGNDSWQPECSLCDTKLVAGFFKKSASGDPDLWICPACVMEMAYSLEE